MSDLIVKNSPLFGDVRFVNIEGKPYAIANDVAKALSYSNSRDAISRHCKGVVKHDVPHPQNKNKTLEINVIPEGDIYRLIIRSKLSTAQKFEEWVFDEVLPQIRETGGYIPNNEEDDDASIMAKALMIAQKTINKKDELLKSKTREFERYIEETKPKIKYADEILSSDGAMLVTNIAADYGLSARSLNKILEEERIQRKSRGQWILYKDYMGQGYTKSETDMYGGKARSQTLWTQKGRMLIHEVLSRRGISALLDLNSRELA